MSDFRRMLNGNRRASATGGRPESASRGHNPSAEIAENHPRSESAPPVEQQPAERLPPRAGTAELPDDTPQARITEQRSRDSIVELYGSPIAPHPRRSSGSTSVSPPSESAEGGSGQKQRRVTPPQKRESVLTVASDDTGDGQHDSKLATPTVQSPSAGRAPANVKFDESPQRSPTTVDGADFSTTSQPSNTHKSVRVVERQRSISPSAMNDDVHSNSNSRDQRSNSPSLLSSVTAYPGASTKGRKVDAEQKWNLNLAGGTGLVEAALSKSVQARRAETENLLSGSMRTGSMKKQRVSRKNASSPRKNTESGVWSPAAISPTESVSLTTSPRKNRTFADCMKLAEKSLPSEDRRIDRAAWIEAAQVHNLFLPHQLELLTILNKLPESLTERIEAVSEKLAKGGDKSVIDSFLDESVHHQSISPTNNALHRKLGDRLTERSLNHVGSAANSMRRPRRETSAPEQSGNTADAEDHESSVSSNPSLSPGDVPLIRTEEREHSANQAQVRGRKSTQASPSAGQSRSQSSGSENYTSSSAPSVNRTGSFRRSSGSGSRVAASDYGFVSFVSELALSSFQLSIHDEPVCVDVDVDAAMLFIDISGYSKVSAALEARGAYTLFSIVNAYVSQLVDMVVEYGGQVIKFAGDAIKCIWYYRDLGDSTRCAVHCAKALQEQCGRHAIPNSDMTFSIHIGVVAGSIRSTVFRSSTVKNMESAYHLISGEPLHLIGDVVDAAKAGEICISEEVKPHLCGAISAHHRCKSHKDTDILVLDLHGEHSGNHSGIQNKSGDMGEEPQCDCPWGAENFGQEEHFLGNEVELDMQSRQEYINAFISPKIAMQLRKGKSQSEMAEMKLLTVLFIHKTETEIDIADWFEEVQHVIDQFRCAIVQIIEDDKGVHIIAAVNLFLADREPAATGIQLADALINRQCGCTIGLATGVTFCGVVGNTSAARFDITGNVCVRACRLMQHAVVNKLPVAIGESVVQYSGDQSMTMPLGEGTFKGVVKPVKIFGIAKVDTSVLSSISLAASACPEIHKESFQKLHHHVVDRNEQRSAVVVRGSANSGKGVLCARAMYNSGFVVISHTGVQDSRPLDVLWTIGKWFSYHRDPEINALARDLLNGLQMNHNIRSTAIALRLVNMTVSKGMRNVVLIKQCQRLDAMSMSFLRQSVQQRVDGDGRWGVLATVVPQPGTTAWSAIATTLGSDTLTLRIGHLTQDEVNTFIAYRLRWGCDKDLAQAIRLHSGWLVGLLEVVSSHLEEMGEGKMTVSTAGEIRATDELRKHLLMSEWASISRKVCAKAAQLISGLSMSAHTVLKVIAVLSNPFLPVKIQFAASVSAALLDGIRIKKVVKEIEFLLDMYFLEKREPTTYRMYSHGDGASNTEEYVTFESPALLNVILETVLPAERVAIGKAAANFFETYHELDTCHCHFALGHHHHNAGNPAAMKDQMRHGLEMVEQARAKWEPEDLSQLRVVVAVETRKRGIKEIIVNIATEGLQEGSHSKFADRLAHSVSVSLDSLFETAASEAPKTTIEDRVASMTSFKSKELPPHLVRLKTWPPPIHFGAATLCLRKTAIFITELAVNAAQQQQTDDALVKAHWTRVNTFIKFVDQVDRVIGFKPVLPNEKEFLIQVGTPSSDFNEVCTYGRKYTEYIDLVVNPRAKRLEEHVLSSMYVPHRPSYDPVFSGLERKSLETALLNSLANWEAETIASLRNGLMELATQGWVPVNPEMNIERQRDCYLRKRTHEPQVFLCLLFVNLSISKI